MSVITTRIVRAVGTLLTAAAVVTASTAPAQAVTQIGWSGYPGNVSLPRITGTYDGLWTGHVTFPARTVTESPRYPGSWQYVCVTAELDYARSTKYWLRHSTYRTCSWISPSATYATVGGVHFTNLDGMATAIYGGNVTVTWQLQSGTVIGSRVLDYNALGDYACATLHCWTGTTPWGGAYIAFD